MHRGRLQSQGDNIEKSENWSLEIPLCKIDADDKMKALKIKHSKQELKKRQDAFNKASKFIEITNKAGGAYAQIAKTFMVKNSKNARIDIEVIEGKAFV